MGIFFRRSKRDKTPLIRGEGMAYILRAFALAAILAGCIVAFWYNFKYRFEKLEEKAVFSTLSNLMTDEQKQGIMQKARRFEDDWGVDVLMEVNPDGVLVPKLKTHTLFIGFVPEHGQGLLILPPLLKKAIPAESIRFMTTELNTCAMDKAPDICLTQVLLKLDTLLKE